MVFVKWLGAILVDKVLTYLARFIKERVHIYRRKVKNAEVIEKVEKAETEEEFKDAVRKLANRGDDDMGGN